MSPEGALKFEIEAVNAKRSVAASDLDEAHDRLKAVRNEFEHHQNIVNRLSDRIEALTEALYRLERDQ